MSLSEFPQMKLGLTGGHMFNYRRRTTTFDLPWCYLIFQRSALCVQYEPAASALRQACSPCLSGPTTQRLDKNRKGKPMHPALFKKPRPSMLHAHWRIPHIHSS